MCSVVTFVNLGWVVPAAARAYRVRVFADPDPTPQIGEQGLGALGRRVDEFRRDPAFAQFGFPTGLAFDYHRRVAGSFSPLVLAGWALILIGAGISRRWLLGVMTCAALVAYFWLYLTVRPWGTVALPAVVAAWCPNLAVMLASAVASALHHYTVRVIPWCNHGPEHQE